MRPKSIALAVVLVLLAFQAVPAQTFVLRTWATPAAGPSDGDPLIYSSSFALRPRVGGPFVGFASSSSFDLWGCGAYTPVEAAFFASASPPSEPLCVTLRWTVESLASIVGFNVYRSTSMEGPYERINADMIAPESPAVYEDRSVWPGVEFWYQLWVVRPNGDEEQASHAPVSARTGGSLVTKLYAPSPNPFSGETTIQHDVASGVGGVRLVMYDVVGRVVKTLSGSYPRPGRYFATWDGTNDLGQRVAAGVYFCSFEADGKRETRPVVLLK